VDEAEYALRFEAEAGAWQLLDGPAADHTIGDTRATVLRYVRTHPGATPKAISEATGIESALVRKACSRMANDAQLIRKSGGYVVSEQNGDQG
jgi:hypothetical protein